MKKPGRASVFVLILISTHMLTGAFGFGFGQEKGWEREMERREELGRDVQVLEREIEVLELKAEEIAEFVKRAKWIADCNIRTLYPSVPDSVVVTAVCPQPGVADVLPGM